MLIIIEGADNTGKTTLATHLQEIFSLEYLHLSQPKCENPFQEYMEVFGNIKVPTVIDRIHLSEYVYANLWRGGCKISEKQFELLDLEAMDRFEFTIIIHAQAPNQIILERCKQNREEFLKPEQIEKCANLFHEIIGRTQIPVLDYYSHIDSPEDISEQLCKMGLSTG